MQKWLAIVAYRCEVAGKPADSIDIQVRYLEAESDDQVESLLKGQPICSYENDEGETVAWPLVRVLASEQFLAEPDGSEVVGFIAGCHEFVGWAGVDRVVDQ